MKTFINYIGQLQKQKKLTKIQLYLSAFGILIFLTLIATTPLLNSPLNKNKNTSKSHAVTGPIVWTAASVSYVMQNDAQGSPLQANIKAAKCETESFQIAIKAPAGGLTNINLLPATLVNTSGGSIDVTTKTLYREHYVYITKPVFGGTNKSLGPGWYPDGLIPFADPVTGTDLTGQLDAVPYSLPENENTAIWVDVVVPRTASAGTYQGTFTVISSQGNVSVPVTITVWNFTLPVKPALMSSFSDWQTFTLPIHQELLRNRIVPQQVGSSDELSLIDNYGLNTTDIGFYSGAKYSNCTMGSAPSVSSIQNAIAQHQTIYTSTRIPQIRRITAPTFSPELLNGLKTFTVPAPIK